MGFLLSLWKSKEDDDSEDSEGDSHASFLSGRKRRRKQAKRWICLSYIVVHSKSPFLRRSRRDSQNKRRKGRWFIPTPHFATLSISLGCHRSPCHSLSQKRLSRVMTKKRDREGRSTLELRWDGLEFEEGFVVVSGIHLNPTFSTTSVFPHTAHPRRRRSPERTIRERLVTFSKLTKLPFSFQIIKLFKN